MLYCLVEKRIGQLLKCCNGRTMSERSRVSGRVWDNSVVSGALSLSVVSAVLVRV